MTYSKKRPREWRLATAKQLWVLNRARMIELRQEAGEDCISNAAADKAIKRSMAGNAAESLSEGSESA